MTAAGNAGVNSTAGAASAGSAGTAGSASTLSGASAGGSAGQAGSGASGDTSAGGTSAGSGGSGGSAGAADLGPAYAYACNLVLGIQTTSEWYREFDDIADDARWEEMHQDSAHLEKWADPMHEVWALEKNSPCSEHPEQPDRVVFMGVNYDFTTVEEFLPLYVDVMNNIKAKYPSVQRVDVMTYTRAPNNMECVDADRPADSWIRPAQDEAIAKLVTMMPGFAYATPKWEVQSCDDFTLCPHLTGDANKIVGATLATYFDGK
jgi:hypothetical protein